MKLYFFIKVQHTGDTDLGQADMSLLILFSSQLPDGLTSKVSLICGLSSISRMLCESLPTSSDGSLFIENIAFCSLRRISRKSVRMN